MRPWYFGNPSVRSPLRLRDGVLALQDSPLQGHMRGREGDAAFRNLLGEKGVVSLGLDATESVGRKWRLELERHGFLYPRIPQSSGISQQDVGPLDVITPNGKRLIEAATLPAIQECFLRSLIAFSALVDLPDGSKYQFYPFPYVLSVLLELKEQTGIAGVTFLEMALILQMTTDREALSTTVSHILALRAQWEKAPHKLRFSQEQYGAAARRTGLEEQSFRDYADTNIRYLKATGMVHNWGRGIAIEPGKELLARLIVQEFTVPAGSLEQYQTLCQGASLPTDQKEQALEVLQDLLQQAAEQKIPVDIRGRSLQTAADISLIRFELEEAIAKKKEEASAGKQAEEWREIALYMELLASRKYRRKIDGEHEIVIPKSEAPAYLEWTIWRAFLAVDSMVNRPYEARRFRVDQDFLPIGTAPGNGPDLILEFADFVLAVEVTLTSNSRQEAMEGEPVRRHIADLMVQYSQSGKPVYGLFLANQIDPNTAETFRVGSWYTPNNQRMNLSILPMTLPQFLTLFQTMFQQNKAVPQIVLELIWECEAVRKRYEAPEWKEFIEQAVHKAVLALSGK